MKAKIIPSKYRFYKYYSLTLKTINKMNFGNNTQINPPYTKEEIENSKKMAIHNQEVARNQRIEKLTENIKYLNEQIGNEASINSITPENCKSLLLLRLALIAEKNSLIK